jgi:putative DNA primase/helicase
VSASSAELIDAALGYAARGWPVFPCNPKNKQPLLGADKDENQKPIRGTGGLKKASTDPEQIRAWWKRWPNALIGLCTGHPTKGTESSAQPAGLRLFVLDFDPREDPDTGEVWTLDRLKRETEEQLGCALPISLAILTPSDGVHLYLLTGDDGPSITNRGNLPDHVDVRGLGGYVIAPPSVLSDGRRYRYHRREPMGGIARAPEQLLELLRSPKGKAPPAASAPPQRAAPGPAFDQVDDAVRKYALAAFDEECRLLAAAPMGDRNNQINARSFVLGQLVGAGALSEAMVRSALQSVVAGFGRDYDKSCASIDNGLIAGMAQPRDLSEIAANARRRAERGGSSYSSRSSARASGRLHPPAPDQTTGGRQSSQSGGAGFEAEKRGRGGGSEGSAEELTRRCALHPLTDLGNLERFLERFGRDFLYVEAWGWLAWDGRRWNREMALPLLARSAQATIRAIQEEADFIRSSGVPFPDPLGDIELDRDADDDEMVPAKVEDERKKRRKYKSAMWYRQRELAKRTPDDGRDRLDSIVQVKSNGEIVLYSDKLAAWGRTSESSGHITCVGKPDMAGARLAAMTGEFDADPLLLNVENGTIVFLRPEPERGFDAAWSLREHRREDRMTKICAVTHDSTAACPRFDAFLERVQPDPEMRDFLDVWAGYNSLGLADAQKMAIFYGEGSNGKGVWINTVAHILGDYAWATGIETFIDQGRYRKGSDASPDLAALAGRRMVYANEPENNSKFSDGLIKELTSDEPKGGVRELMKPPFELQITFSNTVSANTLPGIGTDHGIQRRVQVVPWSIVISGSDVDPRLKDKLKAESAGILNRMIAGAVQYLDSGLPTPQAIKDATVEYQQDNDLLGKFLRLCVARVPGESVGARPFHRVFAAWQTWAGLLPHTGKPWSEKHLNGQLRKKGFKQPKKSSNMKWLDVGLRFDENAFCDHDETGRITRPVDRDLPVPRSFAGEEPAPWGRGDDGFDDPPDPLPQRTGGHDLPF